MKTKKISMKKYEKYKQSGVQWLGEVPEHWEVKRLRFTLEVNPAKSELNLPANTLVSFVPMEAVNMDKNLTLDQEKYLDEVYKGYTYFKNGDVVLAKITPCFENGKSAIALNLTNGIGFGTTELHVLRANSLISNQFLYYFIKSEPFMKIGESEMYGAGGQKRVPEEFIKNFLISFPPLDEQTAIADFLDNKLGEIDLLIGKQQTLLEKLAEQRTATITTTVTKGLNPNAPMKQSSVEWLGEVPEHWEIVKNKYVLEFSKGLTITKENLTDEGIPCVNYGEIHSKYGFEVNPEKHFLKCVPKEYILSDKNALLKNGDFVFADTSEDIKGSGNFTYLNSDLPVFAGYHTIIASLNLKTTLPRFLAYVFDSNSHRNQIRTMVKGVKVFSITQAFLKNTFVWLPPLEEQIAIADYLDKETAKIDRLCDTVNQTINRLQEYRTALITQVVTGKIKVA
ncbi:restriction endonuclease subunit S [Actinobacillus equuli]|uniref:restriction endonuclease subunit S n=1 Tax=Actinobacillus equuli TaxID=718 RepID=UPI0024185D9B|nr:restriction endonuclease subunit S [Actinobacillus equuli]MDG4952965.1 restriction endonuclease subunit S [Actinobacillus equuli subsp. equuli]